jgi:tetratricopeptide (TPR) repeat protein
MVALAPGRLPAKADAQAVLNAAVAFEKTGARAKARRIYEAAVRRWPDELALEMGLGNAAYAVGDRHAAESAFRRATRKHPDAAPAFNNLAVLLIEDGRWAEAYSAAQRAVALGEPWTEQSLATLRRVEAQRPRQTSRR